MHKLSKNQHTTAILHLIRDLTNRKKFQYISENLQQPQISKH